MFTYLLTLCLSLSVRMSLCVSLCLCLSVCLSLSLSLPPSLPLCVHIPLLYFLFFITFFTLTESPALIWCWQCSVSRYSPPSPPPPQFPHLMGSGALPVPLRTQLGVKNKPSERKSKQDKSWDGLTRARMDPPPPPQKKKKKRRGGWGKWCGEVTVINLREEGDYAWCYTVNARMISATE